MRRKIKSKGINCLKISDNSLTNPIYIAEVFNKHFLSVAENNDNYKALSYSQQKYASNEKDDHVFSVTHA
jgi:hypothetical protein